MSIIRVLVAGCAIAACSVPNKVAPDSGSSSQPDGSQGGGGDGSGGSGGDGSGGGSDAGIDAPPDADTTAPVLQLTGKPAADGNQPNLTFTYTVDDQTATIECRLDAQAYAACPLPSKTFNGVADGNHSFDIKATAHGVTGALPTYAFVIDTVAPTLAINTKPALQSNQTTGSFTFTAGMDATSVTCALDGGAAAACSSSKTYNGLSDASHTFVVAATDAAGNTRTQSYTWTVDTVAPVIMISGQPPAATNNTSAAFQFTVTGATTETCTLDGGAAQNCTTSASYTGLANGNHTFVLAASDAAGNTASQSITWNVDTIPPSVMINSSPAADTNSTSASFTFSAEAGSTTTCQLDGANPQACNGSFTATVAANVSHSFTVRATDAVGNVGTASFTWMVDTIAPVISIDSHPGSLVTSRNPSFTFHDDDGSALGCSIDFGGNVGCAGGAMSYSNLADGGHTFAVSAQDGAGNIGVQSFSWTIDATPPAVSSPSYNCDVNGVLTVNWTASDATSGIASGTCSYPDTAHPFSCTSIRTWQGGVSGATSHFTVQYTDVAGNASVTKSVTVNSSFCQ